MKVLLLTSCEIAILIVPCELDTVGETVPALTGCWWTCSDEPLLRREVSPFTMRGLSIAIG
jgi:hypothetical protein